MTHEEANSKIKLLDERAPLGIKADIQLLQKPLPLSHPPTPRHAPVPLPWTIVS